MFYLVLPGNEKDSGRSSERSFLLHQPCLAVRVSCDKEPHRGVAPCNQSMISSRNAAAKMLISGAQINTAINRRLATGTERPAR